jgi:hypothetical protein
VCVCVCVFGTCPSHPFWLQEVRRVTASFLGMKLGPSRGLVSDIWAGLHYFLPRDHAAVRWDTRLPLSAESHAVLLQSRRTLPSVSHMFTDSQCQVWAVVGQHCVKIQNVSSYRSLIHPYPHIRNWNYGANGCKSAVSYDIYGILVTKAALRSSMSQKNCFRNMDAEDITGICSRNWNNFCISHKILVSTENCRTELVLKICQAAANTLQMTALHKNNFRVVKNTLQIVVALFADDWGVFGFSNSRIVKVHRRLWVTDWFTVSNYHITVIIWSNNMEFQRMWTKNY